MMLCAACSTSTRLLRHDPSPAASFPPTTPPLTLLRTSNRKKQDCNDKTHEPMGGGGGGGSKHAQSATLSARISIILFLFLSLPLFSSSRNHASRLRIRGQRGRLQAAPHGPGPFGEYLDPRLGGRRGRGRYDQSQHSFHYPYPCPCPCLSIPYLSVVDKEGEKATYLAR
ncbi:hypothetical protein P167DRAFT_290509 [Morchella conica CCBAS932]|uniref:Uncharacterized protein n=1 Tax=Morchella conica CCBAS932 TaxID=1392247 RepID=A0A3N4KH21_9PEZI|nr:hypothetical protein P167DRAFT_290509 [Morchella conica CCBAS932]